MLWRHRLKGYGVINGFTMATPDGVREYGATSDLGMSIAQGAEDARCQWRIEEDHRGSRKAASSSDPDAAPQTPRGITSAWHSVLPLSGTSPPAYRNGVGCGQRSRFARR